MRQVGGFSRTVPRREMKVVTGIRDEMRGRQNRVGVVWRKRRLFNK